MKLKLRRIARREEYTIGHLLMKDKQNGEWVKLCDTLEDKDRGLDQSMSEANIARLKVKGKTAIPTGTYEIVMDVVSPKFLKKPQYKAFCGGKIPRFKYVKGFRGVCMHSGVDQDSTEGCPIVGENKVIGKVVNSWATFKRIYPLLQRAANNGERIMIDVV